MRSQNPFTEAAAVPMTKTTVGFKGRSAGKVYIGRAFKGLSDVERKNIMKHSMATMRERAATRGARRETLRKKIAGRKKP